MVPSNKAEEAFEHVMHISKATGNHTAISVALGTVRSAIHSKAGKTKIDFDMYRLEFDLLPSVREGLIRSYDAYRSVNFQRKDYSGGITIAFEKNSIQFTVFGADAKDWFRKVYSALDTKANFEPVALPL